LRSASLEVGGELAAGIAHGAWDREEKAGKVGSYEVRMLKAIYAQGSRLKAQKGWRQKRNNFISPIN
jgi:hypothetical protein